MEETEKKYKVYTPAHIANFFLLKPNHTIDNLKLNKLVYITYGFCLALLKDENDKDENGKPKPRRIFHEPIQAWKFGPVIPSIYHEFKTFGYDIIDTPSIIYNYAGRLEGEVQKVDVEDEEVMDILSQVYKEYGDISSMDLVDLTHQEGTPWADTYKDNAYYLEIDDGLIEEYYEKLSEGKLD